MKLRVGIFAIACIIAGGGAYAAFGDDFSFDNFAIVDSDDADVMAETLELNAGAMPVNVSGMDIAGIMLGMPYEDVYSLFHNGGAPYALRRDNAVVYTISKDWKSNLDYECRQQGIFVPAELTQCIRTLARNRGLLYASELHLVRDVTGETIDVFFTSNATDNVVWRVEYNNDVNDLEGDDEKFEDQREKKIMMFWQGVLDKYGVPNSGTDMWITTTNAYDPTMTAYYGSLVLQDFGRYSSDAAKNVNQSREHFQVKPYAF